MIRAFIKANIKLSELFEKLFFFEKNDGVLLTKFFDKFHRDSVVADVGGGKKPAKIILERQDINVASYDGYDIDIDELNLAKEHYNEVFRIDLTEHMNDRLVKKYDYVICRNTLEHVDDAAQAVKNLSLMLNEDGCIYLKLPCKHAIFANLNLVLPQEIKKKFLHFIFPWKIGDGFPVFYDKSTPNDYTKLLEDCGFKIKEIRLIKWSSYFSFFFPFYVFWRLITLIQNLTIKDYCESFEIVANYRKKYAQSNLSIDP